jgi:competence protein ComEC
MQQQSVDNIYFRPAIPLLFALISGIVAGYHFPGGKFPAAIIALVCSAALIYNITRSKTARLSPLFLFCCLGYLALLFWTAPSFSPGHIVHYQDNIPRRIEGTVSEEPVKRNRRTSLYMDVLSLAQDGKALPVEGRIRVTLMGDSLNLKAGDRLSFVSRIRSIRNFNNPGGFDYERFMAFKKIHGSAYTREDRIKIIGSSEREFFRNLLAPLRRDIGRLIETRSRGRTAGVLKALIVGDKTDMDTETRNAFNRLGLGHLLAISGLHIGIVATLAFFLFQRLFSFFPYFVTHARVIKAAAVVSIFPVLLYGLISGMSPSTQRAVIMVCIFLAAFRFEKEHDPLNTLAVAALAILICNPPSLFSISFQLSFTAVTFIFLGLGYLPVKYRTNSSGILKWANRVIVFLGVSFLAILGTLPLVMHYFNLFSFVGLPANCFAVPLIGFMAVPMGLLAAFCYPLSEPLAALGVDLASAILDPGIRLILSLSEYDFVSATTITPSLVEICCYYLIFSGILFFRKSRGTKIILAAAVLVLMLDISYWTHRRWFSDEFKVTALDVGQGSAVLLEFPKGDTMMIDGGGFSDNASFDVGERIVAPYLLRNKIRTVDTLVLTHPNADHLNGLIHIAKNFHVKTIWTNGQKADTLGYKALMAAIKQHNIPAPGFNTLARTRMINGVEIKILHPSRDFNPDGILAAQKGTNDNSIVIKARYGESAFLFPGDITIPGERDLLATSAGVLSADVLFSPHHGSKSSSSTAFLDRVHPGYVIICAGWKNRFHFPHPSVLKKYRDRGGIILRTDLNGAIRVISNGKDLIFKPTIITGGNQTGQP